MAVGGGGEAVEVGEGAAHAVTRGSAVPVAVTLALKGRDTVHISYVCTGHMCCKDVSCTWSAAALR